jgi:hypothetical protein
VRIVLLTLIASSLFAPFRALPVSAMHMLAFTEAPRRGENSGIVPNANQPAKQKDHAQDS